MGTETDFWARAEEQHRLASDALAAGREDDAVDHHVSALEYEGDAIALGTESGGGS